MICRLASENEYAYLIPGEYGQMRHKSNFLGLMWIIDTRWDLKKLTFQHAKGRRASGNIKLKH